MAAWKGEWGISLFLFLIKHSLGGAWETGRTVVVWWAIAMSPEDFPKDSGTVRGSLGGTWSPEDFPLGLWDWKDSVTLVDMGVWRTACSRLRTLGWDNSGTLVALVGPGSPEDFPWFP